MEIDVKLYFIDEGEQRELFLPWATLTKFSVCPRCFLYCLQEYCNWIRST